MHADAVVVGEAEDTWPKLVADAEAARLKEYYVAGPLYDDAEYPAESTYHHPDRPSLDGMPPPRRDLLRGRYFFDSIVTTRGCPYQCRFCGTSRFYGGTVRHRPVDEVADEIRCMGRQFMMMDDDIFGDIPYRAALYGKMSGMNRYMRWHGAGSLAIVADPNGNDALRLAARSGLNLVFVGLESAEDVTLSEQRITPKLRQGKQLNVGRIKAAIDVIKSHGIMVAGFFVIGFDTDTRETFDKTLAMCDATGVVPIPFLLMPLPGTPMWDDYEGRFLPGLTWDKWDAVHAVFDHPAIGPREREEMLYRLRRTSYTLGRIMKRLRGLPVGRAMFSFMMQMGLRRSFEYDFNRVKTR
jgi:radical SAM superfamily enzyme YgiQ (UPF0313 family)